MALTIPGYVTMNCGVRKSARLSLPEKVRVTGPVNMQTVSDWPLLNALLNTAGGATWVSLHHGGGVGMGFSQHAGMVIVCDGTEDADARLARVLWNDPATGVMRHADAGYEQAKACAERHHLNLPMI